ncbi:WD repeat-containing protein 83 [Dinochytrium kinnereticum]|nr:WD repeat-containing protein 83 [Dinochytrium kinnereticum]
MTGAGDKLVKLWNPKSGLCIKTYAGHGWEVLDIDVTKDNTRFASVGGDRSVILWDVGTGNIIRRFSGHGARINAVAFNADGTVLVSGSYDATVKCWDLRAQTQLPIQTMTEAKDSVSTVKINGHEILAGCVDGKLRNYDIRAGLCVVDDVKSPVTCASFSNDNNCILVSSLDDTIRLLDKENGEVLAEYKGHKNHEYKVSSILSNDDAYVISGSEDGKVYCWDLVEGTLLKTLAPHDRLVTSVTYHPKSDFMVSTSKDGTAKVFTAK